MSVSDSDALEVRQTDAAMFTPAGSDRVRESHHGDKCRGLMFDFADKAKG